MIRTPEEQKAFEILESLEENGVRLNERGQAGVVALVSAALREAKGASPKWTTEPPTVPGYWWWRPGPTANRGHLVEVFTYKDEFRYRDHLGVEYTSERFLGLYAQSEWCGPIQEPRS